MDETAVFLTIAGMTLVTCVPRVVPVLLLASRSLPGPVVRWLSYVPTAVLSAMLFPSLLLKDASFDITPGNLFLLAAIPAFFLAWRTRSFFGTVALGMGLVAAGRWFLG
ncbi:MAG: AzlD domain-containing protein [Pseudodesulfovibrio sp.]|uniref:Branched-chain amino acid transport n=1 Tax=Pseudodesulfovibrio aespoeensis (strain ATCC 700646 / DSM 10631 / Aspo-2) TaxID=643562 RepID=E6VW92_PSEA9|nr:MULTISPECIES: AzlD domain-containing protein [Pseudodesulfovibrio]MBU4191395.1 AzlD domain-containing protein [Pseudomonadota bacterium]ADU63652.1 branched-chain amino acid transport [Pseudodesulfovibrio aespoeensis Aspo-2]MBU4244936.1 AzlD domain-containing protein [Pseudomonadota bacterium]MBU4378074.1 AzlD domain-containing protein [Pseudomonadota bacterium]MBU4475539.1 AzlD domain-containing protein [Pseudomonadota bacterium]